MEIALFHIKRACRYRVQLFMDIANVMLNFLVQYYLWTAVLSSNRLFFEDKNRMIIYYFYISLLSVLMTVMRSGDLRERLLSLTDVSQIESLFDERFRCCYREKTPDDI